MTGRHVDHIGDHIGRPGQSCAHFRRFGVAHGRVVSPTPLIHSNVEAVCAGAAPVDAALDALRDVGVTHIHTPPTPRRVREAAHANPPAMAAQ